MTDELMLKLRNLKVIFPNAMGVVKAVEGIDLDIRKGECLALVGESGCGKSVTSLAIMKLLNSPPALMQVDELCVDGIELKDYSNKKMQDIRGKKISMIFQDAMSALNPVMTVGRQIQEVFLTQKGISKKEAKERSIKALELVGIPEPERRYNDFPHQLSGGMRQRVLIAMAFACSPELIIADEPTTALDVTVQAQVLDVLKKMQKSNDTSLLLITHDLSIVANMADTICVMYCGKKCYPCFLKRCKRLYALVVVLCGNIHNVRSEVCHLFNQPALEIYIVHTSCSRKALVEKAVVCGNKRDNLCCAV